MLWPESWQNTRLSQTPTFFNHWLWKPSDQHNRHHILFRAGSRSMTDVLGDLRETSYLFQRVSLAVQRYSLVAFRGTFSVPTELD